jgi:hypothetical protein
MRGTPIALKYPGVIHRGLTGFLTSSRSTAAVVKVVLLNGAVSIAAAASTPGRAATRSRSDR